MIHPMKGLVKSLARPIWIRLLKRLEFHFRFLEARLADTEDQLKALEKKLKALDDLQQAHHEFSMRLEEKVLRSSERMDPVEKTLSAMKRSKKYEWIKDNQLESVEQQIPSTHKSKQFLHSIVLTNFSGTNEPIFLLPPLIEQNISSLKIHHHDFQHVLYGNDEMAAFIEQHFDQDVVSAYHSLVPMAYKADLGRYCLMFERGGIYSDLSIHYFSRFVDPDIEKIHIFRDGFSHAPWIVSNSIIAAPRKMTVFERCIKKIVAHVRKDHYGTNPLCPTGPNLFGLELANSMPLEQIVPGETVRINRNPATHSFVYLNQAGEVLATNIKQGAGLGSLGLGFKQDYNELYWQKKIYAKKS